MYLNVWEVIPQSTDCVPRDKLAVVELYPLQVVTRYQMFERRVGDQRTVVQLQDG